MKDPGPGVTDSLTFGLTRPASIAERVEQRLNIIRKWYEEGVPLGATLPRSLTAVRLWDDPALGIQKISSPNEFVTTHAVVGPSVKEIDSKLAALIERYREQSKSGTRRAAAKAPRTDTTSSEAELPPAVSQWHSERSLRLTAERRAEAAEKRCLMLKKDLDERDKRIAELTALAVGAGKLRSVK